jgi:hypothetical protein
MSLWNGSPDGHPKDNDMYTQAELEQHYREMTDGSARPTFAETTKADPQFAEFFHNAFQIIDGMEPRCE